MARVLRLLRTTLLLSSMCGAFDLGLPFTYTDYNTTFERATEDAILPEFLLPGPGNGLFWALASGPYDYADGQCFGICPSTFPADVSFNVSQAPISANITTKYQNSDVLSFDLHQFDFGCNILTTNSYLYRQGGPYINQPVNCTLEICAYSLDRHYVEHTVEYTARVQLNELGAPMAPMVTAIMPTKFSGLVDVWFNASTTNFPGMVSALSVSMDTFVYTTKSVPAT